jgi:hypothetical protein
MLSSRRAAAVLYVLGQRGLSTQPIPRFPKGYAGIALEPRWGFVPTEVIREYAAAEREKAEEVARYNEKMISYIPDDDLQASLRNWTRQRIAVMDLTLLSALEGVYKTVTAAFVASRQDQRSALDDLADSGSCSRPLVEKLREIRRAYDAAGLVPHCTVKHVTATILRDNDLPENYTHGSVSAFFRRILQRRNGEARIRMYVMYTSEEDFQLTPSNDARDAEAEEILDKLTHAAGLAAAAAPESPASAGVTTGGGAASVQVWTYIGVGSLAEYTEWGKQLQSIASVGDHTERDEDARADPKAKEHPMKVGAPPLKWMLSDINGIVHGPAPDFI